MLLTDKLGSFKKRVVRKYSPFFIAPFFIFIFFSIFSPHNSFAIEILSTDLHEVQTLSQNGAVSLALQIIDDHQKQLDVNKDQLVWLRWERERLSIYKLGQRWQLLQQRVAAYEGGFPNEFYFWAKQQQVDALLILKKGTQARQILQTLIWAENTDSNQEQIEKMKWLPIWQKRVIKSYLVNGEASDALFAAQRYYQDYSHNELDDRLLRARILLINKREDEVIELLKNDTKNPQGGMLYLLAQLRSGKKSAEKALKSAKRQMRSKATNDQLKFMLWAVVAESAKRNIDRPEMAKAFEFVLAGYNKTELPVGLFDFSADTLWQAYIEYALYLGNRAQYLIGNDKQWLKAAVKSEKKYKIKARSLYALVILRAQSEEARLQAAKGFLNLMHKRKRGAELIKKLFLKSKHFKEISSIPSPIRYDLINIALSRSDIELASNLMTTIQTAPVGIDDYQWQLQRARIFVLGGKPEKGAEALVEIIEKYKTLTAEQLDRFLQVLFDLQTVKKHQLAYQLFETVLTKNNNEKSQREIYFWMAESLKALEKYAAAAKFYLRSATYNENKGFDPWGQTSRYQAAEMLTKSGLLQDAYALYKGLLLVTKDSARRAVLKHELQKLWLLQKPDENRIKISG